MKNNKFEIGDYVVILPSSREDNESYPPNYIYKVDREASYLSAIDIKGQENAITSVGPRPENSPPRLWRLAYYWEIYEYDKYNKPCPIPQSSLISDILNSLDILEHKFKN